MASIKKSDVLVHLATDGGYERFPKFKKCYNFNFIKSKNLFTTHTILVQKMDYSDNKKRKTIQKF